MSILQDRSRTWLGAWSQALQGQLDPYKLADQHPRLYIGVLNGFAFIGYAFVFGVPMLSLMVSGYWLGSLLQSGGHWSGIEQLILGLSSLSLIWASAELFLLQPNRPQGVKIPVRSAAELFAMIDRRVAKFHAPKIESVLLTQDCSIRVIRTPSNGFLISHHNTLCIGAPLLFVLNRDQFRVALRCAIGEFSSQKDPNLGELVNLRESWQRYEQALQNRRSPGAWLLRAFVAWYNPLFQPLSAEAARRHALSRDLYATEVIKDIDVLSMIAAEQVGQQFLEKRFWPTLLKAAERYPKPNARPFSDFEALIRRTLVKQEAERWIIQQLTMVEYPNSDLPTLSTRIATLGYNQLHFIALPEEPAVYAVLGTDLEPLLKRLDQQWRDRVRKRWQHLYREGQREKQRFERLHERFTEHRLEGEAAIKYARMARKYLPTEAAIDALKGLMERNPSDAEVLFQLGRLLLESNQGDGIHAIEQAIALDKAYASRATPLISEFKLKHKQAQNRAVDSSILAVDLTNFHIA